MGGHLGPGARLIACYGRWSSPLASRVRLLLGAKAVKAQWIALEDNEDEVFFELGMAHVPVVLVCGASRDTDTLTLLEQADQRFAGRPLREGVITDEAWAALREWRTRAEPLLVRLYAAGAPGYRDIGASPDRLAAWKREVEGRFGMTLEELANDRYAGFAQLDRLTNFRGLGAEVSRRQFYTGALSIADILLAADLYPLQGLDGLSLGVDLMYYLERVAKTCGVDLREGWLAG